MIQSDHTVLEFLRKSWQKEATEHDNEKPEFECSKHYLSEKEIVCNRIVVDPRNEIIRWYVPLLQQKVNYSRNETTILPLETIEDQIRCPCQSKRQYEIVKQGYVHNNEAVL